MSRVLMEGSFYPYRCIRVRRPFISTAQRSAMDSKRYERSGRSNTESPPAPPSPPIYSTGYSTSQHDGHKSRGSSRRTPSPPDYHRSSRSSRNDSPPQERRRRRRSGSKSSPVRSHRRSRSCDKDRDRDRDRDRSRKYSRRDRSRSRSRGRSRSRDKRRSRSRNRSRDRHRYRESRRHHTRAPSYESDALEDHNEGVNAMMHQTVAVVQQPNAFKNDGSFMEMFKKMQEQMQPAVQKPTTSVLEEKSVVPPPLMVGKRRGGRILKTGMVAKPKAEQAVEQPKDAWSLYMAEVKKYREVCCQEEDNTRPLVK